VARHFMMTADGGSRGNPGPAGYGCVVHEGNLIVAELYDYIGVATNNVAEYSGLIAGLSAIHELDPHATIDVRMDSKLVVEQMSGRWQVKHAHMRTLAKQAREAHDPALVSYTWIPREQNAHADRLANRALDERNGSVSKDGGPIQKNLLMERLRMGEVPTMIYFIRHGETILTPDRKFSGSAGPNPELTSIGIGQAQRVAHEAIKLNADLLIASPLRRTTQTAEEISASTNLEIIFDESWYECDFGVWDGLSIEEVKTAYPKEYQDWVSSTSVAPPGGESYDALGWRVDEAIDKLVAKYSGRKIVVVTHNGVIKQVIRLMLGAPSESIFHIDVAPCSITAVSVWPSDGLRALRSASEQGHLR